MDKSLNVFRSIVKSDADHLEIYLNGIEECQSFRLMNDDAVQVIGSLLSKSASRKLGLRLLSSFLDQCSVEVLEHRANWWLTFILKACNENEMQNCCSLIFDVLEKLSLKVQVSPELSKSFASNHLLNIYQSLAVVPNDGHSVALKCVKKCLLSYAGPSGTARHTINQYLMRFVDSTNESLVSLSGECMLLLQQVKGGGAQGINYKTQWKDYQLSLIGSLHALLDDTFSKCKELHDNGSLINERMKLPDLNLSDDPIHRTAQLVIRFCNLTDYLRLALSEPFPVTKQVMPKKILNIICRGLGVTNIVLRNNPISDNLALEVLLPKIHIKLLELLDTLILMLKGNIRSHYKLILSTLLESLKWTSIASSKGLKRSYGKLRSLVYRVVSTWCSVLNGGSYAESISEHLIQEIMVDITPYQNEFTLKVSGGSRKHLSKKARRQLNKANNDESNFALNHSNNSFTRKENFSDEGNNLLCISALQCLQQVLLSAGHSIRPTILKVMHNSILKICISFYDLPLKKEELYFNWRCRFEIYNTLYTLIMAPHHFCPPPINVIISSLKAGQIHDSDSPVRNRCYHILNGIEKVLHPQKESLLFPLEYRDVRNVFSKLGQERLLTQNVLSNEKENGEITSDDGSFEDALTNGGLLAEEINNEGDVCNTEDMLDNTNTHKRTSMSTDDDKPEKELNSNERPEKNCVKNKHLNDNTGIEDECLKGPPKKKLKKTKTSPNKVTEDTKTNNDILSTENDSVNKHLNGSTVTEDECLKGPPKKKLKKTKTSPNKVTEDTKTNNDILLTENDSELIADLEAAFVNEFQ